MLSEFLLSIGKVGRGKCLYNHLYNITYNASLSIDDSAKASLVSFAPENVDVDWIISETDEYGSWTDRNPL